MPTMHDQTRDSHEFVNALRGFLKLEPLYGVKESRPWSWLQWQAMGDGNHRTITIGYGSSGKSSGIAESKRASHSRIAKSGWEP